MPPTKSQSEVEILKAALRDVSRKNIILEDKCKHYQAKEMITETLLDLWQMNGRMLEGLLREALQEVKKLRMIVSG